MYTGVRLARDIEIPQLENAVDYTDKFWWPEKHVGTQWYKDSIIGLGLNFVGVDNDLSRINHMAWLFLIQLVLCCFAYIVACAGLICATGDGPNKRKSSFGSMGSYFWGLASGVLGFCAIKYNCQEMLWTTAIISIIALILAAITLVLMLIGLCRLCCGSEGLGEALGHLCYFIIGVVFLVLYVLFNIFIVFWSWPFLTGESLEDQLNGLSD